MQIDVFNGDADGLCALLQLRLAQPIASTLITGVKRDIQLLSQVQAIEGDTVTVLDISLKQNSTDLERILAAGARVFYVDHHQAGEIPLHAHLTALIDTDAQTCTSLLVDNYLHGRFKAWAITAAFGDNLDDSAYRAAAELSLTPAQIVQLKTLGRCLNYNSYGSSLEDLHFSPTVLFNKLLPYSSPFDFIHAHQACYENLQAAYQEDMQLAWQTPADYEDERVAVFILPNSAWSRRVSGVFANALTQQYPDRAHAILTDNLQGGYLVSVRSPLQNKTGADTLCGSFATGGGRKSAAGINHLPFDELAVFVAQLKKTYC